jgi:hypothetical protein
VHIDVDKKFVHGKRWMSKTFVEEYGEIREEANIGVSTLIS